MSCSVACREFAMMPTMVRPERMSAQLYMQILKDSETMEADADTHTQPDSGGARQRVVACGRLSIA